MNAPVAPVAVASRPTLKPALLVLLAIVWSACWTSNLDMSLAGYAMSALCMAFLFAFVLRFEGDAEAVRRIVEVGDLALYQVAVTNLSATSPA